MKRDRWVTAGIAAVLAFLLSLGSAGCMITAFSLPMEHYPAVVLTWGVCALLCSAAFLWKRGGVLVLLPAALLAGYLWRRGALTDQLLQLVYRISYIYNRAYDWGVLRLVDTPWDAGAADLPMGVLGAVVSMAAAWTVCRRKSAALVIASALLPLFSCLVVTDTVPAPGNLFALLFAVALLLLTTHVRQSNPRQGNRLSLMAAIPTALALSGLFLAVPQEGYVNQAEEIRASILQWFEQLPETLETTFQEAAVNVQGSEADSVNLAAMGRRIESTVPVMSVTADVGGALYLRGQDYDIYDGTEWTASTHRVEDFSCEGISLGSVSVETRSKLDLLYLPYYPENGLSLVGGKIDNPRLSTQYTFSRTGLPDNWQALAAAGGNRAGEETYLALPQGTRDRAGALLEPILQGRATTTEKAGAIASYVRSSARYDLNPSRMPSGQEDFALWFLESAETGYCVHFATAAVVLLRAADIEARYVSGYMVRLQPGETATVTGENAHAWAEYYEPALNTWLVLEATPANLNEPSGTAGGVPETHSPTQAESHPAEAAAQPTEETARPSTQPPAQPQSPAGGTQTHFPGWLEGMLKLLLFVSAAVACVAGQRELRLRLRRRRQRTGTPNAQALARWQEAELLAGLLKEPPPQALEALAQKAKFSQHTLSPEELADFALYQRAAKKRLLQKPWYLRMAYRYIFAID